MIELRAAARSMYNLQLIYNLYIYIVIGYGVLYANACLVLPVIFFSCLVVEVWLMDINPRERIWL